MSLLKALTDHQLLKRLHDLTRRDQALEAELIANLGEVDARRLYLEQACPSMFHYCVHRLHFAEGVAYKRIAVARAARQFPELLAALESGEFHLTAASLIAPHLGDGSAAEWPAIARHATAQQIKQRIADRKPRADVKTSVRRSRLAAKPDDPTAAAERAATGVAAAAVDEAAPTPRPAATTAISAATLPSQPLQRPAPTPTPMRAPAPAPTRTKARCEPLGAERY